MDLPERLLNNKLSSRLGLHRIDFTPYSYTGLTEILVNKFSNTEFQRDAIELCSRKVAAVSGDVRQAISFCQRAKEIAFKRSSALVTLEDAHQAIQEILSYERKSPLQGLSLHSILFIISVYKVLHSDTTSAHTVEKTIDMHLQLCRTYDITEISIADIRLLIISLSKAKIIIIENDIPIWNNMIRFRLPLDEIQKVFSSYLLLEFQRLTLYGEEWEHLFSIMSKLNK